MYHGTDCGVKADDFSLQLGVLYICMHVYKLVVCDDMMEAWLSVWLVMRLQSSALRKSDPAEFDHVVQRAPLGWVVPAKIVHLENNSRVIEVLYCKSY
jgi:hypothetical protein